MEKSVILNTVCLFARGFKFCLRNNLGILKLESFAVQQGDMRSYFSGPNKDKVISTIFKYMPTNKVLTSPDHKYDFTLFRRLRDSLNLFKSASLRCFVTFTIFSQ